MSTTPTIPYKKEFAKGSDFPALQNSAAEELNYVSYPDPDLGSAWTRCASVEQKYTVVSTSSGKSYLINFDLNFTKKHLITLPKKENVIAQTAVMYKANSANPISIEEATERSRNFYLERS